MVSRARAVVGVLVVLAALAGAFLLTAEGRALDAERAHVADRLAEEPCLETWGADEGAMDRSAAVSGLTPAGLRVTVQMPYAYSVETDEGTVHADTATAATYVVGPFGARRLGGDTVDPC